MVLAIVFMALVAVAFLGGVFCVCHAGEKEGICKYENENEKE